MANKFLYLLGAGASCKALPLVKDMPDRFKEFASKLDSLRSDSHKSIIRELKADINWLAAVSDDYESVKMKELDYTQYEQNMEVIDDFCEQLGIKDEDQTELFELYYNQLTSSGLN